MNPTCKTCGGDVAVVLRRAWCLKSYALGGCGAFWVREGDKWTLKANRQSKWGSA